MQALKGWLTTFHAELIYNENVAVHVDINNPYEYTLFIITVRIIKCKNILFKTNTQRTSLKMSKETRKKMLNDK